MQKNVLVLCTGNSCRSQMAHGYLKKYAGAKAHIYSAGVETHELNADAVAIMKEDGIDISQHTSNLATEYSAVDFDYVITVCDNAKERCPYFPAQAVKLHYNFNDPSKVQGSPDERKAAFVATRDAIKTFCKKFVADHL